MASNEAGAAAVRLLTVLLVFLAACSTSAATPPQTAAALALEHVTMDGMSDHDTLAYIARTNAALLNSGHGSSANDVETALDALWAARYTAASGGPGWGLDVTFDAFSDGSTNPADTIYSYTSAMAALAFLDGYAVLDDTTQLDRAKAAMAVLLDDLWGYSSGGAMSVWYSDQPADQANATSVVHNVNALTLAALARIDRYDGASFDATKRAGIEAMISAQEGYLGVAGQWRYRLGAGNRNDLTHHSYMVLGTVEAGMPEAGAALAYLWSTWFRASNADFDRNNNEVMGSTDWGPGDALTALTMSATYEPQARRLAAKLADSVNGSGVSSYADPGSERSIIRYGLGTAMYAARIDGDGSLFP